MTLPEIQHSFDVSVNGYLAALDRYTDEQFAARPSAEAWSLAQMYEHLYLATTYFFLANAKRCTEKRKGQEGGELNDLGRNLFKYNSFPPVKLRPPDSLRAPEPVGRSRDEYRTLFQQLIPSSDALMEAIAADDGTYKALQPAFGWLTAREWYHVGEMHLRHHHRQQQELEAWLATSPS
ncbi:DinB family protein [Telluribacter sp. SYSU D00476]|uniref:DinB family protein n=1 Tax=Telluribacter sp. SYSU D00476 TaxID=2811430 RepID=UPI001FF13467|nr:DinB family protein [Telluribacter sp. SYSU D00476]